jgi:hypothetical protein
MHKMEQGRRREIRRYPSVADSVLRSFFTYSEIKKRNFGRKLSLREFLNETLALFEIIGFFKDPRTQP